MTFKTDHSQAEGRSHLETSLANDGTQQEAVVVIGREHFNMARSHAGNRQTSKRKGTVISVNHRKNVWCYTKIESRPG